MVPPIKYVEDVVFIVFLLPIPTSMNHRAYQRKIAVHIFLNIKILLYGNGLLFYAFSLYRKPDVITRLTLDNKNDVTLA